jgi:hypothetical protein
MIVPCRPYFVMELVKGTLITAYLRDRRHDALQQLLVVLHKQVKSPASSNILTDS